jgi:hypothetical protein
VLRQFPRLGPELEGRWSGLRFILGLWRWMLIVYQFDEPGDRVTVITIKTTVLGCGNGRALNRSDDVWRCERHAIGADGGARRETAGQAGFVGAGPGRTAVLSLARQLTPSAMLTRTFAGRGRTRTLQLSAV